MSFGGKGYLPGNNQLILIRYDGGSRAIKMRARVDSDANLHLDHHLKDQLLQPADDVDFGTAGRRQGALQHLQDHHAGHHPLLWFADSMWQQSQVLLLLLQRLLLF